tara:strand:- start:1283 stop:3148 length:1866 start_codon:yes stop_codon:yes gene_type:complete
MLGTGLLVQLLAFPLLSQASESPEALQSPEAPQSPRAARQTAQAALQGAPKLLDCIEAPYAYVALDGDALGSSKGDGGNTVQKLLADPSLDAIFGGGDEAAASNGSLQSLSLVRSMLRRGASELELAMTGIVARKGQPLLVLRARLRQDAANALRLSLEGASSVAVRSRKLGDHQTYTMPSAGNAAGGPAAGGRVRRGAGAVGPGDIVELALVGNDLIVANDSSAMREVLVPQPNRTGTAPVRRVLSADPRFNALRKRLDVPAGSLLAYGDWHRLGRRLQSYLGGVPAQLLNSSGLGSARSVMMTLAPAKQDFAVTLLLDFEIGKAKAKAKAKGPGIDGWFAATEPVSAKTLLRELPRSGLGGMVLSVDLAAVADHSPRSACMVWDLRDAYRAFGLGYERNVLARLASRGTVQLHFDPAGTSNSVPAGTSVDGSSGNNSSSGKNHRGIAVATVSPVYSVRAKSRTAAEDLFSDMRRVVTKTSFGEFVTVKDAKGKRLCDVIHLHGKKGQFSAYVCVSGDSVLLAQDQDTLVQVHGERRRNKPRNRRDQSAGKAIKAIGGDHVAGLFDVDLAPLFQRIELALNASALNGVDLSSLPKRHIGYLDTDRQVDGAVVRIRVLSSK